MNKENLKQMSTFMHYGREINITLNDMNTIMSQILELNYFYRRSPRWPNKFKFLD